MLARRLCCIMRLITRQKVVNFNAIKCITCICELWKINIFIMKLFLWLINWSNPHVCFTVNKRSLNLWKLRVSRNFFKISNLLYMVVDRFFENFKIKWCHVICYQKIWKLCNLHKRTGNCSIFWIQDVNPKYFILLVK